MSQSLTLSREGVRCLLDQSVGWGPRVKDVVLPSLRFRSPIPLSLIFPHLNRVGGKYHPVKLKLPHPPIVPPLSCFVLLN